MPPPPPAVAVAGTTDEDDVEDGLATTKPPASVKARISAKALAQRPGNVRLSAKEYVGSASFSFFFLPASSSSFGFAAAAFE